jgi:hypothetical protein
MVSIVCPFFLDAAFSVCPMKTPKQAVTHKPMNSTGPQHPKESSTFRRIPWQDVCKFLAGAFFVNLARVSVPPLGTNFMETPESSGIRSVVHAALFVTFFYLGFIKKWKRILLFGG